jgi:hypothetical protein
MPQLFDKIARAYQAGGVTEIGRRAYKKYKPKCLQVPYGKMPLFYQYYFRREHNRVSSLVQSLEKSGFGKCIDKSKLLEYKSSDTLFVLASGNSINEISDAEWKVINKNDSIGLNRWPVHDFVPTYYAFELPDPEYEEMQQTFLDLLEYRKDAYSDTPTIIKDLSRTPDLFRSLDVESRVAGDLLLSRDSAFLRVSAGQEPQRRLLQWLHSHGCFSSDSSFELLYRVRASISYLIHFALIMGYERIVLCGVDMVNSEYFFMKEGYRDSEAPIPETNIVKANKSHPTNDPDRGRITLEDLIYIMDETILKPEGVELYVENPISELHPRVPVYTY